MTLDDQDRSSWDADEIAEGLGVLDAALRRGEPGPYQVQAAIAACHTSAARADETDWSEIAVLYGELARMNPSAIIELNRAVAVCMADGPAAGLVIVDALDASGRLAGYHLLPATPRTYCVASNATTRRPPRTAPRSNSRRATPSGATWNAGLLNSRLRTGSRGSTSAGVTAIGHLRSPEARGTDAEEQRVEPADHAAHRLIRSARGA